MSRINIGSRKNRSTAAKDRQPRAKVTAALPYFDERKRRLAKLQRGLYTRPAAPRVTQTEVAERAGFSQGTVSRALSFHPEVHPAVRAKVLQAARELGYQPGGGSRLLRRGYDMVAATIVGRRMLGTDLQEGILASIQRELTAESFFAPVFTLANCRAAASTGALPPLPACGLGLLTIGFDPTAKELEPQADTATVLVDAEAEEFDSVSIDYAGAVTIATRHLLTEHRTATVLVTPTPHRGTEFEGLAPEQARLALMRERFEKTARRYGVEWECAEIRSDEPRDHELERVFQRLAGGPMNVVVVGERLAAPLYRELRKRGDPRLVSVGDDDRIRRAGMTAVRLPTEEVGRMAVDMMTDRIYGGPRANRQLRLGGKLMRRHSSEGVTNRW